MSWDPCLVVLRIRVSLIRLSSSSSVWSSFISCLKNSNDLSKAWYSVRIVNSIKKAKSMNSWLNTKDIKLEENYTDDESSLNVPCSSRLHSSRKFESFSVSSSVVSWSRVFIIFHVRQRCVRESWHSSPQFSNVIFFDLFQMMNHDVVCNLIDIVCLIFE